jgi:MarR family transcriptional regulator, organic hydroperoxide resistance regulator
VSRKRTPPLPTRHAGPSDSPGLLLWKVSNAWQRAVRQALKPFELTHSQFVLLATATWYEAEESLTQARLSALSGIDPMTTSQLVRTLETAGFLERREHRDDPRAKAITVTEAGRQRARTAVVAVEAADAAFFKPVEGETSALVALFHSLEHRSGRHPSEVGPLRGGSTRPPKA